MSNDDLLTYPIDRYKTLSSFSKGNLLRSVWKPNVAKTVRGGYGDGEDFCCSDADEEKSHAEIGW